MKRRSGLILAIVGCALWLMPGLARAQNPPDVIVVITSPVQEQQLFGLVTITGSASHPTAFDSYTLEYNDMTDPNAPWLLVQARVRQQVQNDVLGAWNTIVVPDGVYQLRLRVYMTDGQVGEAIVTNLRVINTEPTPVPTAAGGSVEATPIPTLGATPTSPVQQPPSNNPSGGVLVDPLPTDSDTATNLTTTSAQTTTETRINTGRVQSAFCAGVYLTFAVFGIMVAYTIIRGRLRPFTRRLVYQVQDEPYE